METRGYKILDTNLKCLDYQYVVGKRHKHDGVIELCRSGFHFCTKIQDLFNYYDYSDNVVVAEVIARDKIIHGDDKSVTNDLEIVRIVSKDELLNLVNIGHDNVGICNTGYHNTGDWNTGDCNTGNWNAGNWNTGYFNVDTPKTIRVFGKEIPREEWERCYKPEFLFFGLVEWVPDSNMTDDEKRENPEWKTTGGYLRIMSYKEAFKKSWDEADPEDRIKIKDIPGFDADMFYAISGIRVE